MERENVKKSLRLTQPTVALDHVRTFNVDGNVEEVQDGLLQLLRLAQADHLAVAVLDHLDEEVSD